MIRWLIIFSSAAVIVITILSLTVFKERIKAVFYVDHMERDDRIDRMKIEKIISRLHIMPGDYIADIGAGSGLFTRKFSSLAAPSGKVYAVDINKKLLKHIDSVNAKSGITNVMTVLAGEDDPNLPEHVSLIFICDTLHYIDRQEKYVKTMADYLNSGGRLAVISFNNNWPPMSNRFTEDDLDGWMKKAGLELISRDNFVQDEYFVIYKKK